MKSDRHAKILEIIQKENIETQDELMLKLSENGYYATQATISRDINELGLIKVACGKDKKNSKYKYARNNISREHHAPSLSVKYRNILSEAMIKIESAGNLVVLKTYSGMAQAAGAVIDSLGTPDIVGSIAGDDTVLIIMKTQKEAEEFTERINKTVNIHS